MLSDIYAHVRVWFIPILIVIIFGLLAGQRLDHNVAANRNAIIFARHVAGLSQQTGVHWTLSPQHSRLNAPDKFCIEQTTRFDFLCVTSDNDYLIDIARADVEKGSRKDLLLLYFLGASLFDSDPTSATAIWANVPQVSHFLARQALKFHEAGNIARSETLVDIAQAISSESVPESAPVYLALCQTFIEKNDRLRALAFCQKAESASSTWVNQVNVARRYLDLQEYNRAAEIANSLLTRGEGVSSALRIRGTANAAQGDFEKALADYASLEAAGALDRYAMYELAEIYYKMGGLEQARGLFEVLQRDYGDERAQAFLKSIDSE